MSFVDIDLNVEKIRVSQKFHRDTRLSKKLLR